MTTRNGFQDSETKINQLEVQIAELEINNQALLKFWRSANERALPLRRREKVLLTQLSNSIGSIEFQLEQNNYEEATFFIKAALQALKILQEIEE